MEQLSLPSPRLKAELVSLQTPVVLEKKDRNRKVGGGEKIKEQRLGEVSGHYGTRGYIALALFHSKHFEI